MDQLAEIEGKARIGELLAQRNAALDRIAMMAGEMAVMQHRLAEARMEIAKLKAPQ
jgi:hypothetical protein